jgi:CheY-like chemotaxis protein
MRKRVLVVDDCDEVRESLTWSLVEHGFEAACANSGGTAIEMLSRGGFDAAVIDLRLPDMTGTELLAMARSRGAGMPALLISGFAGCLDAERYVRMGFSCVLTKPVRPEILVARLAGITGMAQPVAEGAEP